MNNILQKTKRAFTLIELLVVVAILVLLIAIIVPTTNAAISRAHRVTCLSNLRQIGVALTGYLTDHQGKYPISAYADYRASRYGMVGILEEYLPYSGIMTDEGFVSQWVDPRNTCPLYRKQNISYNQNTMNYGSYAYRHDFQGAWNGDPDTPPWIGEHTTSLAGRSMHMLRGDRRAPRWGIQHWSPTQYGIVWDKGWFDSTIATTAHSYHGIPAHHPIYNVLFADGRASGHRWIHRNGHVPSSVGWKIPLEYREDEYYAAP